jgi:hypothetical protein
VSAPTRELLAHFDRCHVKKFRVPAYINGGKHAKMLANITGTGAAVTIQERNLETGRLGRQWESVV